MGASRVGSGLATRPATTLHSEGVRSEPESVRRAAGVGSRDLVGARRTPCGTVRRALLVPREHVVLLRPSSPGRWGPGTDSLDPSGSASQRWPFALQTLAAPTGRHGTPVSGPKAPPGEETLFDSQSRIRRDTLWPGVGGTLLNLWEVLRKCRKPCGQGVSRTPHRGVISKLRPLTSQNSTEEGFQRCCARSRVAWRRAGASQTSHWPLKREKGVTGTCR